MVCWSRCTRGSFLCFFFSSRRRHTRFDCDWSSDVCSSDLATGRKNIIMTGLWTEVCITWPTIEMLGAGYNVYVVEDCCGATSPAAQDAALSRMVQAGAVRVTTIGALLEWQRDWKNKEHYDALMKLLRPQAGAYGVGIEYAYTMVHHAPQSAQKPQIVPKTAAGDGHASGRGVTPAATPAHR